MGNLNGSPPLSVIAEAARRRHEAVDFAELAELLGTSPRDVMRATLQRFARMLEQWSGDVEDETSEDCALLKMTTVHVQNAIACLDVLRRRNTTPAPPPGVSEPPADTGEGASAAGGLLPCMPPTLEKLGSTAELTADTRRSTFSPPLGDDDPLADEDL